MYLLILLKLVLALTALSSAEKKTFYNHKVYKFTPKNVIGLKALKSLENDEHPSGLADIFIKNVQELIDNEAKGVRSDAGFDWSSYHNLEEIYIWLEKLSKTYPDKVTLLKAGETYQNRPILGVRVSFDPANENRGVFMESNIHAREWITSAVNTYILNEFLTTENETIRDIADSHDWYFFPIFNPDGFAYTHREDRLWRKTRTPHGRFCVGTDPNRNWNYHWKEGGASGNPCSETYAGPEPFSEPCTKALSKVINSIGDKLIGYISFHSYSQLLLLSYGYTYDHMDNYNELLSIGLNATEVLSRRYNTEYITGSIAEAIYVASGGSMDWAKGTFHTPVTYTYELRDKGEYGFLLPANQIIPTSLETLDSILSIFQQWKELHPEYYHD